LARPGQIGMDVSWRDAGHTIRGRWVAGG